ncbi:hypothetical protein [Paenibacillus silvae]|uniref:hypothetical protein n=1 Tax=Paenibacillus silvae TaxID=1325358 RepID=UPI001642FF32|nr:hypothetical protein [Paenibacillus silvae]MCK6269827.1 hypothetical protein [Paenibacillus silvae]
MRHIDPQGKGAEGLKNAGADATGSKGARAAPLEPVRTAAGLLGPITRAPKPGESAPAKAL